MPHKNASPTDFPCCSMVYPLLKSEFILKKTYFTVTLYVKISQFLQVLDGVLSEGNQ